MLIDCSIRLLFSKTKSFKKFINGVILILVMYKICKYCLSKARLGVSKVLLCTYRVFGFFRCCLAFFKGWSGLFCLWLPGNPGSGSLIPVLPLLTWHQIWCSQMNFRCFVDTSDVDWVVVFVFHISSHFRTKIN